MSLAGDLGFPDRAGWIPVGGDLLLDAGAVASRAAPAGPEFSFRRGCRWIRQAHHKGRPRRSYVCLRRRIGEQDGKGKNSFHDIQDFLWGECATDRKHRRSKDRVFNMLNPIWYTNSSPALASRQAGSLAGATPAFAGVTSFLRKQELPPHRRGSRSYHLRSLCSSLWRLKLRDFSADFLGRDSIQDGPPANDDVRGSQLIL